MQFPKLLVQGCNTQGLVFMGLRGKERRGTPCAGYKGKTENPTEQEVRDRKWEETTAHNSAQTWGLLERGRRKIGRHVSHRTRDERLTCHPNVKLI